MSGPVHKDRDMAAVTTAIYVERFLQSSAAVDEPDRRIISDRLRADSPTFQSWELWLRRHSVAIPLGTILLLLRLLDTGAFLWPAAPAVLSWLGALILLAAAGHLWLIARQGHHLPVGLYREISNGAFPELVGDSPLSDSPDDPSGAKEK